MQSIFAEIWILALHMYPWFIFTYLLIYFRTSLIHCRKFGLPYLDKEATAATRAALPIPNGVCGIFVRPNKGMAVNAWESLASTQMLIHAIVHEGCTDTVIAVSYTHLTLPTRRTV